ncbi:MAG: hypothetical protein Q4G61_09330 [Tissierellia bacterium]|nr:hypothetical protein [Tissierellia bacterium]
MTIIPICFYMKGSVIMHIPSKRVHNEMKAEDGSLWYVPANGGKELALLIKMPTNSIKALISGCSMSLTFGKHDRILCRGVKIQDIPDSSVSISGVQKVLEEHYALIRALKEITLPIFLFNEMDVCLAWTNAKLTSDSNKSLDSIGQPQELYVGQFTDEASHALDCFDFSLDKTRIFQGAHTIPILEIIPTLEEWRVVKNIFIGNHEHHTIDIDEKNEGEIFERIIWATLESVFPLTLYKCPQVKIGKKTRELTDVFSYYTYGSFFIEAKDLSVINAGYSRDIVRCTAGIQKQVKRAICQLIGASKAFLRGETIFDGEGHELSIERNPPPHCIILITELMHYGDWKNIEIELINAMQETGALFHLLDLRELITILKGCSGKAERLDYHLIKRCEMFVKTKSIFIRSRPKSSLHK